MPRNNAPAPAITGDVARMIVQILADGEQSQWSLDYMASGFSANPAFDLNALAITFDATYKTQIKALLSVDSTYEGTLGVHVSRNDVSSVNVIAGAGVGTGSATHLDKMLAADIQKQSSLKGQHGRGRFMFGPLPASAITPGSDTNRLSVATLALFVTFGNNLVAPLAPIGGTVTWAPCVSTRPLVGSGNVVTHAQPVIRIVPSSIVGTVKRRRIGRGI